MGEGQARKKKKGGGYNTWRYKQKLQGSGSKKNWIDHKINQGLRGKGLHNLLYYPQINPCAAVVVFHMSFYAGIWVLLVTQLPLSYL